MASATRRPNQRARHRLLRCLARTSSTYAPISDSIAPASSTVVLGFFMKPKSHVAAPFFKPPREQLRRAVEDVVTAYLDQLTDRKHRP